jgi:basic membrane lipoprotein Med (substrate-binding protein (PBP1-ABC) superfamily)
MKHIKKFLAISLTLALVFCLASCSMVTTNDTDTTNDNIKIGVILNSGKDATVGTAGINNAAIGEVTSLGYGLNADRFKYVENVDGNNADATAAALKTLVNFECNIIFATDPSYYDDIEKVAADNPSMIFAVYGCNGNGSNIYGYKANITGAAYLSGIAAGMKAASLKVPQLGFIAESEGDLTTLNAFASGAQSVYKDVKVQAIVSKDAAASAQKLITNGCVVIASDYESEDIAKAAQSNNVFFCGYGTDTFATTYANSYLCAPLYNFTQYYVNMIKAIIDGTKLADFNGGYVSGTTFISDLNDKNVVDGTKAAVDSASTALNDGTLSIQLSATVPNGNVTLVK